MNTDDEEQRKELLADAQINFAENIAQLKLRFESPIGQHEALDRCFMIQENFYEYIVKHPFILLDSRLFGLANKISDLMADLYQDIGNRDLND